MSSGVKWVLGTIVGLLLVVGLAVGAWKGGWWINKQSQTNQYNINVHSQAGQETAIAKARDYATQINAADNAGQKAVLSRTFCQTYLDIDNPPSDLQADYGQFCN